ncbi:MAG: class I poly(R)-hydroxyalkanoic acid synthase, partial [Phenylobacterium sp.]
MSEQPASKTRNRGKAADGARKGAGKNPKKSRTAAPPPPQDLPSADAAPAGEATAEATFQATASATGPGAPQFSPHLLTPEQRETLENLSKNLARAAMTAQGAITEAALRQADRPAALSPDPFHVAPALTQVLGSLAAQPDRLIRAQADLFTRYMDLWASVSKRAMGVEAEPVAAPPKGDKRFADPEWSENPVFDAIKQSYLVTSDWLHGLVAQAEGVDPLEKRRVEFFMKTLTDAFAPSNFLISNPVALREAMATHGESLVKGMENFAADLARGGGQLAIAQTDYEMFKIGENVATAPGKVVFQTELFQLLQFTPTTDQQHEIPLLIFPPWINKYYILDLRPENSMIRWLTDQGFSVFVVSWVNPDQRMAEKTFENYMFEGIYTAIEAVCRQCDVEKVNTVGYCIGGTLLSCALAHMAAVGYEKVNSATFFAAQQDFSEAGDLLIFTNEDWLKDLEKKMDAEGGVLSGQTMADTFNALRANDLIWSFFVNNYLLGKEPR